jgi:hypothetical protein
MFTSSISHNNGLQELEAKEAGEGEKRDKRNFLRTAGRM